MSWLSRLKKKLRRSSKHTFSPFSTSQKPKHTPIITHHKPKPKKLRSHKPTFSPFKTSQKPKHTPIITHHTAKPKKLRTQRVENTRQKVSLQKWIPGKKPKKLRSNKSKLPVFNPFQQSVFNPFGTSQTPTPENKPSGTEGVDKPQTENKPKPLQNPFIPQLDIPWNRTPEDLRNKSKEIEDKTDAELQYKDAEYKRKLELLNQEYQYKIQMASDKEKYLLELQKQKEAQDLAYKSWYEALNIKRSAEERSLQDTLRRSQYYNLMTPEAQNLQQAYEGFQPYQQPTADILSQKLPETPKTHLFGGSSKFIVPLLIGGAIIGGLILLKKR